MREPSIRPAGPEDLEAIARFQESMALLTEGKRLDPDRIRAGVAAAHEDPAKGRYLIAELEGLVVGSLLCTREWSDWRNGWFWWIQSVWVEEEVRGRGVYRALHVARRDVGMGMRPMQPLSLFLLFAPLAAQQAAEPGSGTTSVLRGQVLDRQGRPWKGAEIFLQALGETGSRVHHLGLSKERGQFRGKRRGRGPWLIVARHPEGGRWSQGLRINSGDRELLLRESDEVRDPIELVLIRREAFLEDWKEEGPLVSVA